MSALVTGAFLGGLKAVLKNAKWANIPLLNRIKLPAAVQKAVDKAIAKKVQGLA